MVHVRGWPFFIFLAELRCDSWDCHVLAGVNVACLLPTGRRGECGTRVLFFAYIANYTIVIIFLERMFYIYHTYT